MNSVKRTERGWAGHFCGATSCLFKRNTLLEYKHTRIVVSTVGAWQPSKSKFEQVTPGAYYETLAFHANSHSPYCDADVNQQVFFESPWYEKELNADWRANEMHERVVEELMIKMKEGIV